MRPCSSGVVPADEAGLHADQQNLLLALFEEAPQEATPAGNEETNPVRDLHVIHTQRGQIHHFCTPDMRMLPALEITRIPQLQSCMKRLGLDSAGLEKLRLKRDTMTDFVADSSDPTCRSMSHTLHGYVPNAEDETCEGADSLCCATTTQKNDNKHCFRYYCFTWPCPAGNNCRSNQCIQKTGPLAPDWRDQDKLGCDKWLQYNLALGIRLMRQQYEEDQHWIQYAKLLVKFKKAFTALVRCELSREYQASKKGASTQRAQQEAGENAAKAKKLSAQLRGRADAERAAPVRNPLATHSAEQAARRAEADAEHVEAVAGVGGSRRRHGKRGRGRARSPSIELSSLEDRSRSPPPRRSPRKHSTSNRDRDRSPPGGSRGSTPHHERGGGRSRPRNATNSRPRGGAGRGHDQRTRREGSRRPRGLDERYQDF